MTNTLANETRIVRARGISKQYPGGVLALDTVDLDIFAGDRFVLLGPNGAGKSTLVRILASLSRADSGEYTVCGLDPRSEERSLMRTIGVVTQGNDLDPSGTTEELLRFQCRLFDMSRSEGTNRAQELIEAMDLGDHARKRVETLSGGNKRKLHCALALVHRPRLLFLDEPTVGMDPEVRARFWDQILRINRNEGTTVILTTQYLEEAERNAEQLALIRNGRVAYRGTVRSFVMESSKKKVTEVRDPDRISLEEGYLAYLSEVNDVAG